MSALCYHNALGLYPAPFWYPTHWRVELRCLHIRKHAQGDHTTVRDYSFAGEEGFEPTTYGLTVRRSNQLSYSPNFTGT